MPRSLNSDIRDVQLAATDWRGHAKSVLAYELYNQIRGKLFSEAMPDFLVNWDDHGRLKLREGDYHVDRNGMALYGVFDLPEDLNTLEIALAVCHNATHLFLETHDAKMLRKMSDDKHNGSTWYHPMKFKHQMLSRFGIEVDKNGRTVKLTGEFWEMLMGMEWTGYSVATQEAQDLQLDPPDDVVAIVKEDTEESDEDTDTHDVTFQASAKPKSKMVKWICGCQVGAIRAAVVLYSVCLKCQQPYKSEMTLAVNIKWHNDYKTLEKLYKGGAS